LTSRPERPSFENCQFTQKHLGIAMATDLVQGVSAEPPHHGRKNVVVHVEVRNVAIVRTDFRSC